MNAGEENRTPSTLVLSERCLPLASLPRISSRHELVAESGVSPDDLLVMSQPSLPAPPPHQEHAVRFELTMTGFADRRLANLATRARNL